MTPRRGRARPAVLLVTAALVACGRGPARRGDAGNAEAPGSGAFAHYIGQRTDSVPPTIAYDGGSWLGEVEGVGYGLQIRVADDGTEMAWLVREAAQDARGDPVWEIADILVLPELESTERLAFFGCTVNGEADVTVLAIVRVRDEPWLRDVRRAWRAEREQGRIVEIAPDGVACENDSYGI